MRLFFKYEYVEYREHRRTECTKKQQNVDGGMEQKANIKYERMNDDGNNHHYSRFKSGTDYLLKNLALGLDSLNVYVSNAKVWRIQKHIWNKNWECVSDAFVNKL